MYINKIAMIFQIACLPNFLLLTESCVAVNSQTLATSCTMLSSNMVKLITNFVASTLLNVQFLINYCILSDNI